MPLRNLAIDFDSFFASVEQQDRPELRGKPVGVVPVLAETTGLIAVSGEAKRLGLKRNTRVAEARQRCPGIVIVESRPEVYIDYHRRLKAIIESCVPVKKVQSIDELECELTADFAAAPERARQLALAIKAKIAREAGDFVRCSIGIGPNWFLAKVASDMEKPNGLVVIDAADIPEKLLHLKLTDFCGIGEAMARRLSAAGIDTVAQLYATSAAQLRAIWGSVEGARFHAWMNGGRQERVLAEHNTIGHGHVLPPAGRNTLNKTFGKNSVYFGGAHGATDYAPMRIAFTRIPDPELEEIDRSRNRRLKPAPPPPAAADESS